MPYLQNGKITLDLSDLNLGVKNKKGVIHPIDIKLVQDAAADMVTLEGKIGVTTVFHVIAPMRLFYHLISAMKGTSIDGGRLKKALKV